MTTADVSDQIEKELELLAGVETDPADSSPRTHFHKTHHRVREDAWLVVVPPDFDWSTELTDHEATLLHEIDTTVHRTPAPAPTTIEPAAHYSWGGVAVKTSAFTTLLPRHRGHHAHSAVLTWSRGKKEKVHIIRRVR